MSRADGDLGLLESNESKPWNPSSQSNASFAFHFEQYMPTRPCIATNLHVWSRLILRFPVSNQEQQEHIPLTSRNLPPAPQVESDSSICESDDCAAYCDSVFPGDINARLPEPLIFNIHFEDRTYVKQLDFWTFARWESVEALLEGFEGQGAVIEELWDVRADMPIWSGDWDARVYPGLEVDVTCWKPDVWEDESSSDSDGEEEEVEEDDEDQGLAWDDVRHRGKRWWFGRWRMKVEQEAMGARGPVHEPSRRTISLGVLAMATFLGIVFVFCTV